MPFLASSRRVCYNKKNRGTFCELPDRSYMWTDLVSGKPHLPLGWEVYRRGVEHLVMKALLSNLMGDKPPTGIDGCWGERFRRINEKA